MTTCQWCHLPIQPGEKFACFKNFATHAYEFYHRRRLANDCHSLFLVDHLLKTRSLIMEQIMWSNIT